jgi:hypothetical protein
VFDLDGSLDGMRVVDRSCSTYMMDRNSTGFYQIDAARFPGPGSSAQCLDDQTLTDCLAQPNHCPEDCGCKNGNEGMRLLAAELRSQGYGWGTYSGLGGCTNAACEVPGLNDSARHGYIEQDFKLMIEEWGSDYIMLDAAGITAHPGSSWWGWCRLMQQEWADKIANFSRPVILHNCHNYCTDTVRYTRPPASSPSNTSFPTALPRQHPDRSLTVIIRAFFPGLPWADTCDASLQQDRSVAALGGLRRRSGSHRPARSCLPARRQEWTLCRVCCGHGRRSWAGHYSQVQLDVRQHCGQGWQW